MTHQYTGLTLPEVPQDQGSDWGPSDNGLTTCSQAGCVATELRCYKLALRRQYVLLCASCHATLTAIGMALTPVERRVADVQPVVERRHMFRPAWLERLTARDDTWRAA